METFEFGPISGVPVDAPIWRKAPAADLYEILRKLSAASHHYADDSAKEWGSARLAVQEAAELVNKHKLDYSAIVYLHGHSPQLVTLAQFVDTVLKDARK